MLDIPNPRDPGKRVNKSSEGIPIGKLMTTRWMNYADNLKGL